MGFNAVVWARLDLAQKLALTTLTNSVAVRINKLEEDVNRLLEIVPIIDFETAGPMSAVDGHSDSTVMLKKLITKEEWGRKLAEIQIEKEVMNKLVMNYTLTEGYGETAEMFSQESGTQPEIDPMTVRNRLLVKKTLIKGEVEEAIQEINDLNPEILDTNPLLFFHLQLQKLIELIRISDYDKAFEFSHEELVPIAEANPHFTNELEETLALLCFDNKDVYLCPLKELMSQAQRNRRASEVNAAILTSQHREKESKLEILLKMLIWAEDELEEMAVFPRILDLSEATVRDPEPN